MPIADETSRHLTVVSSYFQLSFICSKKKKKKKKEKVQALRGAEVKTYRKACQEIFVGVYCCRSLFFVRCPSFFIAIRKAGLVFLLGGFIFAIFRQPHSDCKFVIQALSIIIIN